MHLQSIDYPTLGVKPRIIPVVSTKGARVSLLSQLILQDFWPMQVSKHF